MVRSDGFLVELVAGRSNSSFCEHGTGMDSVHVQVHPELFSDLSLRIGCDPSDRVLRMHVLLNGRPILPNPRLFHVTGLYDGQWRDKGLWQTFQLPSIVKSGTLQVLIHETTAHADGFEGTFYRDGPLVKAFSITYQACVPLQESTLLRAQQQHNMRPRMSGQKREEQTFGYDQKAAFWKRRRLDTESNMVMG